MAEAANQSGKVSWFGLVLVIALGVWVSSSMAKVWHFGYLHADEAVQWSLAKELSEGTPYSTHQDKFHGPTLATALLISAKATGTVPMDMREDYLRSVVSVFLGLMAAAALILPGVGKGPRYVTAAFVLLTGGCTPFRYYFVQEMLLVCGFVWGIQKYSGLLDIALEGNFVSKPSNGWYAKVDQETGEIGDKKRFDDTQTAEFWDDILANEKFKEYVRKRYEITYGNIMGKDSILEVEASET